MLPLAAGIYSISVNVLGVNVISTCEMISTVYNSPVYKILNR